MSSFTLPLKEVIRITGGTADLDTATGIRKLVGGNIGLGYYPIFDTNYRATLTGKIVDRYYNREIGMESISMFQLALRRKMNDIMPYYNKLYNSEKLTFDPLSTVNLETITNATVAAVANGTAVSTSTGESDSTSRAVSSETPQTQLAANGDYATSASDAKSKGVTESTGNQTNNETSSNDTDSTSTTKGYQGVASELLMRYRESLMNIDLMVMAELEDCFMMVWDNADSFTTPRGIYY